MFFEYIQNVYMKKILISLMVGLINQAFLSEARNYKSVCGSFNELSARWLIVTVPRWL